MKNLQTKKSCVCKKKQTLHKGHTCNSNHTHSDLLRRVCAAVLSLLMCLQVSAQSAGEAAGTENSASEILRQYEKLYTVKVKQSPYQAGNISRNTLTQDIRFITENGRTKITGGMTAEYGYGYSAFFITDRGEYWGFDYNGKLPEGQRALWIKYTKEEQKNYARKIQGFLSGKNCELISEADEETELEDVSCAVIKTDELGEIDGHKFIRTGINSKTGTAASNDFDKLYIYNEAKGIFYLAIEEKDTKGKSGEYKRTGKTKIICFRDKMSKAEIMDSLDEKKFRTWLTGDKEAKEADVHNGEYKRLAKLIYESLKNNRGYQGLYTGNFENFFRVYLQVAMDNNRNIYFSELMEKDKNFVPEKYISSNEANKKIKEAAESYVKLKVTKKNKEVPLVIEYKENQSDTPDTYKLKYLSENNILDFFSDRGCDDIGFFNGILYSSFNGNIKIKDSEKLCIRYNSYTEEIKKGKKAKLEKVYPSFEDKNFKSELNKISIIVPSVEQAKEGDIILFTKAYLSKNGKTVRSGKKCAVITDKKGNAIEDLTAVMMDEEEGAKKITVSEILNADVKKICISDFEIRRILVEGDSSSANENWNVLNEKVKDEAVEIMWMREETQKSGEKFRWIPNTGEYLSLEKIRINAFNQTGIRVRGEDWKVTLAGAEDRNWKKDDKNGNVYNNTECAFEIKVGTMQATLSKNSGTASYKIRWKNVKEPEFRIKTKDNLLHYYDEKEKKYKPLEIKIRPESAAAAKPGDDLLLKFRLERRGLAIREESVTNKDRFAILTVPEKDYIAVYDKKMLWRANLYLDRAEAVLGNLDWNNAHPWNAPASGSLGPVWWNGDGTKSAAERWGYNEWNVAEEGYKGVAGGQLISIPGTKWYHGKNQEAGTGNRRAFNVSVQKEVKDAVAYDYQGWDSPKSYSEKLKVQKELMNLWYTADGTRFKERVDDWPVYCDNFSSAVTFRKYLGDAAGKENDIKKLKSLYKYYKEHAENRWNGELNAKNYNEYVFAYNYGKVESPYNTNSLSPQFFSESSEKPILKAKDGEAAYIPGLSNSIMDEDSSHPGKEISSFVAGTDCIGFVQRSAAYGSKENTIYSALKNKTFFEPPTWSNNTVPEKEEERSAISNFHSTSHAVKISDRNSPAKTVLSNSGENDDDEIRYYSAFKYAVPGDIVWYSGQHIMMISSISEPSGIDGLYLPEDITVLESVYNNLSKTYGVGKNRNLNELKISASASVKNWEIWRQK